MRTPKGLPDSGGIIGKRDLRATVESIYDRWGIPTVPDALPKAEKPCSPADAASGKDNARVKRTAKKTP